MRRECSTSIFEYIDGTVSVIWSKVARLESKRLFHVKTEDGSVYTGTLSTPETAAGRPVEIHVVETPQHEAVIAPCQIVRMTATSNKFWQRFNGGINLGVIYSKGNQSTQYSLGSMTEYVRERWNARAALIPVFLLALALTSRLETPSISVPPTCCLGTNGSIRVLASSCKARSRESHSHLVWRPRSLFNEYRPCECDCAWRWQSTRYKQSIVPPSGQNVVAALI